MDNQFFVTCEETLHSFVCSVCYMYLTVGPIGVTSNNKICGRCSQNDAQVVLDDSYLANKLFPCINRFNGCRQLLTHSQVVKHEQVCLTQEDNKNKCLLCPFVGNVCQVYNHVRLMHENAFINSTNLQCVSFQLGEDAAERRLIRMGNFFYAVIIQHNDQQVCFKLMLYGKRNRRIAIKYKLRLHNSQHQDKTYEFSVRMCFVGGDIDDKTEKPEDLVLKDPIACLNIKNKDGIVCFIEFDGRFEQDLNYIDVMAIQNYSKGELRHSNRSLNNNNNMWVKDRYHQGQSVSSIEQLEGGIKIENIDSNISNDTQQDCASGAKARKNSLDRGIDSLVLLISSLFRCSNCTTICFENLLWCPQYHVKCEECVSDFCTLCDDVTNYTEVDDGRQILLKYVQLPCRWNSSHLYDGHLLRQHEYSCPDRLHRCPLLCGWEGKLTDLKPHWHSDRDLIIGNSIETDSFREEKVSIFLISDSDCLSCEISKESVSQEDGNKCRSCHVRHTSTLGSNVSNLKATLSTKLFNTSSEEFETTSLPLTFGMREFYKVPSGQYYKIQIRFTKAA